MYESHTAFLKWTAAYDNGDETTRSCQKHDPWEAPLPCPMVKVYGSS